MSKFPYFLFLAALLAFNGLIFITPYLALQGYDAGGLYSAFSITCHQLTSRSICLISSQDGSLSIGDCLPQEELLATKANVVRYPGMTAYKLPVCSRDVAIYLAMLLGLIILPALRPIGSEEWPNKWILVAAAVPIALDGGTQLLGFRESTNLLRMFTGAIIGIVLPFYLLPVLNSVWNAIGEKFGKKEEKEAAPVPARAMPVKASAGKKKRRPAPAKKAARKRRHPPARKKKGGKKR